MQAGSSIPPSDDGPPILHIVQFLHEVHESAGGGVTRAVLDLSSAIASRGHRVTLTTFDPGAAVANWPRANSIKELKLSAVPGRPIVFVPAGSRPGRSFLGRLVHRELEQLLRSADLLHLHGLWEWCNLQVARAAQFAKVPVVLSAHGMLDDWSMSQGAWKKRLFLRLFGRRLARQGLHMHYMAEAEREQGQRRLACDSSVIPSILDISPFVRTPVTIERVTDAPHVLFLSRLHRKKGLELLIEAAALLQEKGVYIRWTIAGPGEAGYVSDLQTKVQRAGLADAMRFVGMVTGPAKVDLYHSADLFVLPTSQENFGLVLVEAMASSLPVVTTRGVDIWQELEAAGATVVAKTNTPSLAEAVQRLLSDRADLAARAQSGRAWAIKTFGGDEIARRFERLYVEMVRK